jgi:deazaflavin-dependent oxidoreductase (nitroreductase family)
MAALTPRQRPRPATLNLARLANPLMMRLAGTRWLPLYGLLQHRGRRSGKLFRTPVVVRRDAGGFVVPMPWGEATDWYRNVRAAGGCVIRWKDRDYVMVEPEVVDATTVRNAFPGVQWAGMRRFGIRQCLRLRATPPA